MHCGAVCVPHSAIDAQGPGRCLAAGAAHRNHRGESLVAQRYGVLAFFGDATREDGRVDIDDLAAGLVEELASDARALGCEAETHRALAIIREGTSADRQVDLFRLRRLEGDTEEEALHRVVDLLLAETREDIGEASG